MRDATARFVFTLLTAILLALQFPAPSARAESGASDASAAFAHHTPASPPVPPAHTYARTDGGAQETGRELVPCDMPADDGGSHGLLCSRDRHRTAVGSAPENLSRSLVTDAAGDRSVTAALVAPGEPYGAPGPSVSPSPAVLQVFRC
ncbi:hypothetical protein AB0G71_17420 [Streptomyces sp. NPDC020403]|uniref:hypothetical protein n=1 Tax=unclassified Streptomyces TaxID=2593676 RepID=UPI0033FF622F